MKTTHTSHYLLFSFLSLLIGCMRVGPNFLPPEPPMQESWTEKIPTVERKMSSWWTNYRDERLNRLIDYALEENYNLEAAAYRVMAARAHLGFAIGEYFPQTQQAEGSSFKTHISANAPNSINASRKYLDTILGLRLVWEIDFWGRFSRGVEVAYGEYRGSTDDYQDIQRLLIADIVLAYVQQKTFQRRIKALDHNIAIQYRSVTIAKVRFEGGHDSELDYLQAAALWKKTLSEKSTLEIELKKVTTALAILLGLTPEDFLCRFPLDSAPFTIPTALEVGFPAEVLCRRPDLRRTLDLLFSQSARIGIAISDLYPRISFTGFFGLECASGTASTFNQQGKTLFNKNSLTFFYGPDFSWPILQYGRLYNRIKEQYALLDEGIAFYRNQVLEAYKEVEDSLTFFTKALEEAANLQESFHYAQRSVDISIIQYEEGLTDFTRVLNSQQQQISAEDDLAQAEGNIALAYALIFKSLGSF